MARNQPADVPPAPSNTPTNADTSPTPAPDARGDATGHSRTQSAPQRNARAVGGSLAEGTNRTTEAPIPDTGGSTAAAGNSTLATGRPTGPDSRQGIGGAATTANTTSPNAATSPAAPASPSSTDAASLDVNAPGRGDGSARDQAARAAQGGPVPTASNPGGRDATDDGPSPTISGGIRKGTNKSEQH